MSSVWRIIQSFLYVMAFRGGEKMVSGGVLQVIWLCDDASLSRDKIAHSGRLLQFEIGDVDPE